MNHHQRPFARPTVVKFVLLGTRRFADLLPGFADRDAGRAVQDQTQGPFFVVLDHQHHGLKEIRISQYRRGDQKLTLERFHERLEDSISPMRPDPL